ncbi:MAG: hypothetical protein ABSH48_25165 [Verrucomicrobiota bacterium]|jgi:2'-hydroxyisoflavone reductase
MRLLILGGTRFLGRYLVECALARKHWVRRTARGCELLAPGHPDALVQLVDARDLAYWIIKMVESRKASTYNATGPASKLTFEQMIEQCRKANSSEAAVTWVDEKFLLNQNVKPFSDLPFRLP